MTLNFKKILLAGTAIVAIGAAPVVLSPAYAADEFSIDADDSGTFDGDELANTIFDWGANTDGTGAAAEATDSHDLQVNASGTITVEDTDQIGDGTATVAAIVAGADGLTLTLDDNANDDAAEAVTIAGDVSVGAFTSLNLTITGEDTDAVGDTLAVDINGAVNLGTGAFVITADGGNANNDVNVLVNGNITAASTTLNGGASTATLTLDGATVQTVAGTVDGGGAGEGNIAITGAGTTFTGVVGGTTLDTITASNDGTGSTVTFNANVATANGVTIGDGGGTADTYTLSFDTTGGAIAASGTFDGAATDTVDVVISGGNTVTTNAAWGGGTAFDSITLSGSGTGLTVLAAVDATNINVGAGTTFTTGGTATGAVNFTGAGTVALGNTFGVTGTIDNTSGTAGVGTLTGTGAGTTTVTGNVGATNSLATISYDGTGTFDFDGTVAATTITATSTGTYDFADDVTGAINLAADAGVDLADGADITGTIDNTSGGDGVGNLTLAGSSNISGALGSTNTLNSITVNGVGNSTFSSTVNVDDIDFGGAATVNFNGNVTTTNDINFANNAGTINFADNVNLTGSIDSTAGTNGTVNFAGTSTVSGTMGVTTNSLAAINFNGGSGETVTLNANIAATDVRIAGAGTVQANGSITGAVDFDADGVLRLANGGDITGSVVTSTLHEGTLILEGNADIDAFGTNGTELKEFTVLGSSNTVGAAGNFEAALTNNIDGNTVNVTGTIGVENGDLLSFDVTGATAAGQLTASGNAIVLAGANLHIDVTTGDEIANGQSFVIIDGSGGAGVSDLTNTITDNSFLIDFVQDTANDEDLVVNAVVATRASSGTTVNNSAVGTVFDGIGTSTNAELNQIQTNLTSAATQQAVNDILEASQPTVDSSSVGTVVSVTNQSLDIIGTRLAEVRQDKIGTGMYAGNGLFGTKVWGQFFANTQEQDTRENIDGYDADTYGLAGGIDTADRLEGMTVGLAGAYAYTEAESGNANLTETDINSWQIAAYANYYLSETAFLDVMLGYAYNDTESKRYNVGGTSGAVATSERDGNQYFARAEIGQDLYLDSFNEAILTPSLLFNYINVDQDEYTEKGAGGASLVVTPDDLDIFEIGVALEASWKKQMANGGVFEPAVHVGYRYDVIGDDAAATSSFTGGGATFKTEGFDPAQNTFNVGFGGTVYNTDNWEFTGGYDFEFKPDYTAHSGVVKAAYKF